MTMTSLPSAEMKVPFLLAVQQALGVGVEKIHREMNALELPALDGQVARLGRAGAEDDGVEFLATAFPPDNFSRLRCWRRR